MHVAPGQDYLICDYCGTTHFPDPNPDGVRVLGDADGVSRLRCSVPLVQASIAGAQIVYCNQVLWVSGRHGGVPGGGRGITRAPRTRRIHRRPADRSDLDRHAACPKCRKEMDTHPYGGTWQRDHRYVAQNCSVNWLDCGEIQRIVRAPDAHYAGR